MELLWRETAWQEYCEWLTKDKNTLKKINELIKDAQRHPYEGIGKPEPLRGNLSGWWSRRIDHSNRLVYREKDGALTIASCMGHYE
ncbi:MAG: Txe/YoeB family addiction module toxin [Selenomonadaceae bacterium]|nr:Txe/YoeB family addiction module toxin [Selenomonadaceae bacterium]